MTPEIARNALVFLQRAELKGSEVSQFSEVQRALLQVINPPAYQETQTGRSEQRVDLQ